ncbi:MAG: hypothetical protein WD270_14235 [Acetobacterales bacterium]
MAPVPEIAWADEATTAGAAARALEAFPVLIVKGFADHGTCDAAHRLAAAFMDRQEPTVLDRFEATRSYHTVDIEPPNSKTKRVFRSLIVYPDDADPLWPEIRPCFERQAAFYNLLRGERFGFAQDADVRGFRPQVIHYPRGGGYFQTHQHPLMPMRYGLILNISRKGRDFFSGQTYFMVDGEKLSVDAQHDLGDLCIFRYDLPHGIDPVDPDSGPYRWDASGRWTAVIPLLMRKPAGG